MLLLISSVLECHTQYRTSDNAKSDFTPQRRFKRRIASVAVHAAATTVINFACACASHCVPLQRDTVLHLQPKAC
jgi:hypothetical protein